MINSATVNNVFLACEYTDMRKSIDGLAAIVQEEFKLDPFSSSLFVFCNKAKNKIKILHWNYNGFWLYYKRLEKGNFKWVNNHSNCINIQYRELMWLLDGLSIKQDKAHKKVEARLVL